MPHKTKIFSVILNIISLSYFSISAKAQWTMPPSIDDDTFEKRTFGYQFVDTLAIVSGYASELSFFFVFYGIMSYFLTAEKDRKQKAKKIIHYSMIFLVISILVWVFSQLFIDPI